MVAHGGIDIRDLITGTGPFGPTEIRDLAGILGTTPAAHGVLKAAVRELESQTERSPAASLKLGVCQHLLGRVRDALATLKAADGGALALYYQGLGHKSQNAHDKARDAFVAARKAGYDAAACVAETAQALVAMGRLDEARKELESAGAIVTGSADCLAAQAALLEAAGGPREQIVAAYERALAVDAGHPAALFAMGVLNDQAGNDEEAQACYERSIARYPASVGALLNLGLLYEDRDDYARAQQCYRRILEAIPDHPRARLFLKDSSASGDFQLDEQEMRQRSRLDQVLALPVSDFELSVRSRNCLQKMGIRTLGDLTRTTEEEILASKNFGETSLEEIKEMLASKQLSLGQLAQPSLVAVPEAEVAEPSADEQEIHSLPIGDLNLSVRAKKCTTKLGIGTIGDLVRRTAEDLLECKNFGVTSLNEVREKLAERGLKLRGD